MPAKSHKKLTLRIGHWYRMRGGGFANLVSHDGKRPYPYEAVVYRVHESSALVGGDESYLSSGYCMYIGQQDTHDLVEDVGTNEPQEVSAFRELISWAKAALNGQEDCIAVALPTKKRRPASKQQKG